MFRSNKIGQAPVRRAVAFHDLLAQEMELGQHLRPRFVGVNFHVVADGVRGKQSIDGAKLQQFLRDDFVEKFLRVGEQFARFFAVLFMLKNFGINAAQFPGVEKWRPVDQRHEVFQRYW